jgi:hypothetical protein
VAAGMQCREADRDDCFLVGRLLGAGMYEISDERECLFRLSSCSVLSITTTKQSRADPPTAGIERNKV